MIPVWFLLAITILELGLLVSFVARREWIDVVYWVGVQVINVALIWRAYEQVTK